MSTYCIGDIHGCYRTFQALLNQIGPTSEDKIILLGDYIDRGPDSSLVLKAVKNNPQFCCLKGNHEDLMHCYLERYSNGVASIWMENGGEKTINSFQKEKDACLADFYDFLRRLPLMVAHSDFYFAHAGVNINNPMEEDNEINLWDRACPIPRAGVNGKKVIVGHTPKSIAQIEFSIQYSGKIFLDGGCVFSSWPELGNLVALRLEDMQLFIQKNIEK